MPNSVSIEHGLRGLPMITFSGSFCCGCMERLRCRYCTRVGDGDRALGHERYALQDQVHDRLGRKQSALAQEYRTLADGVAGQTTLAAAADEDKPSIASEVATNKHPIRRRRESSAKSKLRQRLQQRRKHTVCTSDLTVRYIVM